MILFWYVLRDFFRYVFGTLVLTVFLFVLFDFIHKTTKYFARYEPSTKDIFSFYGYQVPGLLIQAFPIAALIASVVTMILFNRTNEITAMRAAGMGSFRISLPIASGGLILSLLSIIIGEIVLPETSKRVHYIQQVLIERESDSQVMEGARWIRDGKTLYHFRDYDPMAETMQEVRVIEIGEEFKPKRTIEASLARYLAGEKSWVLHNVKILYFWPNGTVSFSERHESITINIPIKPSKLRRDRRLPNELSIRELNDIISKGVVTGVDIAGYKVDMHIKLAFHFASFVVCLIGLRFGYRSERSMETAKGILLAIGIGVSYWFFLNSGRALGKRGHLPPLIAGWLANLVVFSYSMISILKTRRAG